MTRKQTKEVAKAFEEIGDSYAYSLLKIYGEQRKSVLDCENMNITMNTTENGYALLENLYQVEKTKMLIETKIIEEMLK